jgi:large subunit ribosomal protein L18Ae
MVKSLHVIKLVWSFCTTVIFRLFFKESLFFFLFATKIFDRKPTKIKNFAIWLRYDSRSGSHNMYREYRDLTTAGAVTQLYRDMGARHRARAHSIQVMRVEEIAAAKCRRPNITQFHVKLSFYFFC